MISAFSPITIKYTKDNGETTIRNVIPLTNVPQNIRAVDLSKLDETQQVRLIGLFSEYQQYVEKNLSTMFNFQDWVEHTTGEQINDLPWRTFKTTNIDVLK